MAKVLIIAEAGVNHNGDINLARQLIDKAKEAGADIIKFQRPASEGTAEFQKGGLADISLHQFDGQRLVVVW